MNTSNIYKYAFYACTLNDVEMLKMFVDMYGFDTCSKKNDHMDDMYPNNIFHHAFIISNVDIINYLLEYVDEKILCDCENGNYLNTPFMKCIRNKNKNVFDRILNLEFSSEVIEKHLNPSINHESILLFRSMMIMNVGCVKKIMIKCDEYNIIFDYDQIIDMIKVISMMPYDKNEVDIYILKYLIDLIINKRYKGENNHYHNYAQIYYEMKNVSYFVNEKQYFLGNQFLDAVEYIEHLHNIVINIYNDVQSIYDSFSFYDIYIIIEKNISYVSDNIDTLIDFTQKYINAKISKCDYVNIVKLFIQIDAILYNNGLHTLPFINLFTQNYNEYFSGCLHLSQAKYHLIFFHNAKFVHDVELLMKI
jgi:hypothetical protein